MRVVGLVVVLTSTMAAASPAAEKLFQDGRAALKAGRLAEACDAFRKSQELEPRVGTLLNLGDCEERRGRIATAWEAFVQARALANQTGHRAAAEADKRAAALVARLPYLTLRAPAERPPALAVTRNGKPVSPAELDIEIPLDPGRYELAATAPGRLGWSQTAELSVGKKLVVEIPTLAPDPTAATPGANGAPTPAVGTTAAAAGTVAPTSSVVAAAPARRLTGKHRLGAGAAIGASTDADLLFGLRIPVQLAPVGSGAVRAVASGFYTSFNDPEDVYHEVKLYALGLGLEYVAPLAPTFYVAAGAGLGLDFIDDNYGDAITRQTWGAARLSPTVRIGSAVDLGLHIQLVVTDDNVVGLGELGVDYYFF